MRRLIMVSVLAAVAAPAGMAQVKVGARGPETVERKPLQASVLSPDELRVLKMEIEELVQLNNRTEQLWRREVLTSASRRVQELQDEMERVGWELMSKQSRLAFGCADLKRRTGPFSGWLGVTFERDVLFTMDRGPVGTKVFVLFDGSPRIAKVEAGSPAEAAGVQIGDEWIAVNGRTILDSVEFSELEKPGATVAIRSLRVGRQHENHLVVGKNPPFPEDVCTSSERVVFALPLTIRAQIPAGFGPAPVPKMTQVMPPGTAPRMQVITAMYFAFGGATLRALDDDDRDMLKVRDGVLVQQVAPATPAAIAGLKNLDVVLLVNGENVRSLADVRMRMAGQEVITLTVQRKGETRVVKLPAR